MASIPPFTGPAGGSGFPAVVARGGRKGLAGALWMYRILVPISFLTFLLEASRVLEHLDGLLAPLMGLLHLPAKAALPLVAGLLTGIYGGIASMAVLDLTVKETTLIAVFLLISHAMIQESAIQGQSGIHPLRATAYRLAASIAVVWSIGAFWSGGAQAAPGSAAAALADEPPLAALADWGLETLWLCCQILVILVVIMTLMEWMKARRVSERVARGLGPLLDLLGLDRRCGLLWLTAALFGISYGGAVIVEEAREGRLPPDALERLHLSIGINHAMIEDPVLFLPLGVHPLWLWGPRLAAAVLAVHLHRAFVRLRSRRRAAPAGGSWGDGAQR